MLATFTVTNNSDALVAAAGDAPGSLRQAIFDANALPGADSITFAASVSGSTIALTEGELVITDDLSIAGPGAAADLVIDAQQQSRVIRATSEVANLTLSSLTITNGQTTDEFAIDDGSGGGIRFEGSEGTLDLNNSTVSGNSTTGLDADGGGIFAAGYSFRLINSEVSGNSTAGENARGGGIFSASFDLSLNNSTVTSNTSGSSGGGIYTIESASLTNSTVSGNASADGGGGISALFDVTLTNQSVVSNNSTIGDGASGGGIHAGRATLVNAEVFGNTVTGQDARGGGIFADYGGLTLLNGTVSGNTVIGLNARGGGIDSRNDATVTNSTISGNSVTGEGARGGGIYQGYGELRLVDSEVSQNTATSDAFFNGGYGGGIATGFRSNVILVNSAVLQNAATLAGGGIFGGEDGEVTVSNSTVSGNTGGGISVDGDVTLTDSDVSGNLGNGIGASGFVSVTGSTISENTGFGYGGGIFAGTGVMLASSTVSQNTARTGGGIHAEEGGVILTNSTVSGNTATLPSFDNFGTAMGGGISATSGGVTLTNSTVSGNSAIGESVYGGGIFSGNGNVSLINSEVNGNTAIGETSAAGAGIYVDFGSVSLGNSTVSENTMIGDEGNGGGIFASDVMLSFSDVSRNTSSGSGGGIYTYGSATLIESTVTANRSGAQGGGIFADFGVTLTDSIVDENVAGEAGGGIFSRDSVTLTDSTVAGNTANGDAGGIFSSNVVALTSSTVSGNTASYGFGGGISAFEVGLSNSTVSGNTSSATVGGEVFGRGGGIYSITDVTLTSSTISENVAGESGGGITTRDGSLTLNNSIVAGNIGFGTASDLSISSDLTANHSLIGDTTSGLNPAQLQAITDGVGNLQNVDPLLGPLADNGGPTQTHALLSGSPAINAGDSDLAVDADGNPLLTDQRGSGFDRIVSDVVDIGALEFVEAVNDLGTAPVITNIVRDEGGVLARPDLINAYAATFDQDVSVSQDDLFIFNETFDVSVDSSAVGFSYDSSSFTATWTFDSLLFDAAFYTFELSSDISGVVGGQALDGNGDGTGGDERNESVYVAIPGDANLDGTVDVLGDAFDLVANLGTTGGATWAQGDFNGDGSVNVLGDAFVLVANLGRNVVPPLTLTSKVAAISSNSFASPVLLELSNFENRSPDEAQQKQVAVVSTANPALAGSQPLDEVFAGEDWLI